MLEKIIEIISAYTEVPAESITVSSALETDLGICSIDFVAILMDFEEEFGRQVPEDKLGDIHTVGDILALLEA